MIEVVSLGFYEFEGCRVLGLGIRCLGFRVFRAFGLSGAQEVA